MNFVSVQKQSWVSDCGLYAIAFATALVFGHNPGCYVFQQNKMRRHLHNCLTQGTLEMFPVEKGKDLESSCSQSFGIHCICRMPEITDVPMVECSNCNEWYHLSCIDVPSEVLLNESLPWICHFCK